MGQINLSKAQELMNNQEFWDSVNYRDSKGGKRGTVSYEQNMGGGNVVPVNEMMGMQPQQQMPKRTPKFDNAILESFREQPPIEMDSNLLDQIPDSFMVGISDSMSRMGGMDMPMSYSQPVQQPQHRPQPQQRQMVNENVQYHQPQQAIGIDYNYIKYLISEAIKENMKGMLNEQQNTLRAIGIGNGNKIQLLNNKGNLYEAELKLKKKGK